PLAAAASLPLLCSPSRRAPRSTLFPYTTLFRSGGGFLLPRHVGLHKAKELVFFGDELSAADAERLGLVNKVVPAAELEAVCRAWGERLAQGPTFALGLSKRLLNRSLQADLDTLFAEEAFTQALVAQSEDMREGIRAFMEKRPPVFKGR